MTQIEFGVVFTCSVEVDECLAPLVVMETLAAVLLQLDLLDTDSLALDLVPLPAAEEAVGQLAVHRHGPPLLGDLVAGLSERARC